MGLLAKWQNRINTINEENAISQAEARKKAEKQKLATEKFLSTIDSLVVEEVNKEMKHVEWSGFFRDTKVVTILFSAFTYTPHYLFADSFERFEPNDGRIDATTLEPNWEDQVYKLIKSKHPEWAIERYMDTAPHCKPVFIGFRATIKKKL